MPQLDVFSFGPQVFWLTFMFFVLYFLILRKGLTNLYKILLFRKRLINDLQNDTLVISEESYLLHSSSIKFLSTILLQRDLIEQSLKIVDSSLASHSSLPSKAIFSTNLSLSGLAMRHWLLLPTLQKSTAKIIKF